MFLPNMSPAVGVTDDPCIAIDMPDKTVFYNAQRKVFAHYFNIFPVSMDNLPWQKDFYNSEWLVPIKSNMWYPNGGFLRTRPMPVVPTKTGVAYRIPNIKREIRAAIARGITGFTYDTSLAKDASSRGTLDEMLQAASEVDSRFKIVLMVDTLPPATVITLVKTYSKHPNIYKINNKVVIAPYRADTVSAADWLAMKTTLSKAGYPIMFLPTFLSLPQTYVDQFSKVADGYGLFGTPLVSQGIRETNNTTTIHKLGKQYMAGISPQGYRPKEYNFWESQNSLAYRNGWQAAITKASDWVQLTTWNDLSETTQVMPYTDTQNHAGSGFYNLTGYYAAWYATGTQPKITHDVLYYFYRKQPVNAQARNAGKRTATAVAAEPGTDLIELVAFLTAPGTLAIKTNSGTTKKYVDAGLQAMTVPLAPGQPLFTLERNDKAVVTLQGDQEIVGPEGLPYGFTDLTYWAGSGSHSGTCSTDANTW